MMMIDLHAHVLPQADHGSDSIGCSLRQLEKAAKAGIQTIVATPHFYIRQNPVAEFLERRQQSCELLSGSVKTPSIQIVPAAEVTLFPGIEDLEDLPALCIENTRYILIELPGGVWNDWVQSTIYAMQAKRRLRPILAHLDRCPENLLPPLLELHIAAQVNADALASFWRRREILRWIAEGKAHVLGSDAHGEAKEYEAFQKAVHLLGKRRAARIFDNAKRILEDRELTE